MDNRIVTDKQIDSWLDSAIAASKLKENTHFVITQEKRGDVQASFARLLIQNRVSPNAHVMASKETLKNLAFVTPAKAGVQPNQAFSGFPLSRE